MPDTFTILAILVTFLFAGMIKGIIGLGLPTVSLAVLTVIIGLPNAMALILIPSFITNLWKPWWVVMGVSFYGASGFFC